MTWAIFLKQLRRDRAIQWSLRRPCVGQLQANQRQLELVIYIIYNKTTIIIQIDEWVVWWPHGVARESLSKIQVRGLGQGFSQFYYKCLRLEGPICSSCIFQCNIQHIEQLGLCVTTIPPMYEILPRFFLILVSNYLILFFYRIV